MENNSPANKRSDLWRLPATGRRRPQAGSRPHRPTARPPQSEAASCAWRWSARWPSPLLARRLPRSALTRSRGWRPCRRSGAEAGRRGSERPPHRPPQPITRPCQRAPVIFSVTGYGKVVLGQTRYPKLDRRCVVEYPRNQPANVPATASLCLRDGSPTHTPTEKKRT